MPEFRGSEISGTQEPSRKAPLVALGSGSQAVALGRNDRVSAYPIRSKCALEGLQAAVKRAAHRILPIVRAHCCQWRQFFAIANGECAFYFHDSVVAQFCTLRLEGRATSGGGTVGGSVRR